MKVKHICADCGNVFYTEEKTKRRLCEPCAKKNKNRYAEVYKNVYGTTEKKKQSQSLIEYMKEIHEYNKSHEYMSYGKYVYQKNKVNL